MRLKAGDTVREGRAVDARDMSVDAETVLSAIRDDAHDDDDDVSVTAPAPGPVHERVGYLRPGMAVRPRTALAAGARSRGLTAPQDEEIASIEAELAAIDLPAVETADVRRELAETSAETERLRERVSELRGRIQARRERDGDTDALEAELAETIRELTEVETDQIAAGQQLDGARRSAREARDARERRMRLADRKANLERAARAYLVDRLADEYATAVAAVPGADSGTEDTAPADPFEVGDLTAALAVARVAALSAPVVVACDRVETPAAAAEWLDAPVVRL